MSAIAVSVATYGARRRVPSVTGCPAIGCSSLAATGSPSSGRGWPGAVAPLGRGSRVQRLVEHPLGEGVDDRFDERGPLDDRCHQLSDLLGLTTEAADRSREFAGGNWATYAPNAARPPSLST